MRQRLLEALKAKFPGVNATVLSRIADKFAKTVTTEEQVTTTDIILSTLKSHVP